MPLVRRQGWVEAAELEKEKWNFRGSEEGKGEFRRLGRRSAPTGDEIVGGGDCGGRGRGKLGPELDG